MTGHFVSIGTEVMPPAPFVTRLQPISNVQEMTVSIHTFTRQEASGIHPEMSKK